MIGQRTDVIPSMGGSLQGSRRVERSEIIVIALIVAAFLAAGATILFQRVPLGHDESVYAWRARHIGGASNLRSIWADYRAPGLPALMSPAVRFGGDFAARLVPLLLAGAGIVVTWAWARSLLGRSAALWSAALLAIIPGYMRFAWQILVDTPGMVFGLGAIAVFTAASRDGALRNIGWWTVPLAVVATYVRFGAPILIGAGLGIVALARWRTMLTHRWRAAAMLGGTLAAMLAVLFIPALTGSKSAPFLAFRALRAKKDLPIGSSLSDFVALAPSYVGPLAGTLLVLGLILAVVGAARGAIPLPGLLIAVATFAATITGLVLTLGQGVGQYVAPAVPPAALVAGAGLGWAAAWVRRSAAVVGVLILVLVGSALVQRDSTALASKLDRSFGALRRASIESGTRASTRCLILTSYTPQVGWYSGCEVMSFGPDMYDGEVVDPDEARERVEALLERIAARDADEALLMLVNRGKRQPKDIRLQVLEQALPPPVVVAGTPDSGRLRYVTVHLVPPPPK